MGLGATARAGPDAPGRLGLCDVGGSACSGPIGRRYGPCVAADGDARAAATSTGGRAPGPWWLQVVDSSPDGVLIVEGDTIVYANRAMEDLAGLGHGTLVNRCVDDLVPPGTRPRHRRLRQGYTSAPRSRPMGDRVDLALCRADGRLLPVEVALAPLPVDGQLLVLATVRDVSARHAEQGERARLAHLLQIVPDGVIVVDSRTGSVVDVNEAAGTMLGYAVAALRGIPATRLSAADDPAFLRRAPSELTVRRFRTSAGVTLDCEVHAVTFDAMGRAEVVNVVRDIGPRLEVERQVRASEESFRAVFERAPVGLAITRLGADGVRTIIRTNDTFARMFGYGPHDLDGKDPSVLRPPPGRSRGAREDRADGDGSLVDNVAVRRYARSDGTTPVGGGAGHQAGRRRRRHPHVPGARP